jgi:hypothetical protein
MVPCGVPHFSRGKKKQICKVNQNCHLLLGRQKNLGVKVISQNVKGFCTKVTTATANILSTHCAHECNQYIEHFQLRM